MPDENISDPPTRDASGLPPEPVEAATPVAADAGKNSALSQAPAEATRPVAAETKGSSAPVAKATPSAATDAGKHEECRSESRVHVRWHVDAFVDGQGVYQGFVKDISLKGADIFLDHNLQNVALVKLHIHVPPLQVTSDHHVIGVSGKIIHSTHDPYELLFRTGVKFLKFNLESDLACLQSRIADH